jgi:hypothetical protein
MGRKYWRVEAIVGKKKFGSEIKYLIKWENWDESSNTWEPLSHLKQCMDMVREFEAKKKQESKTLTTEKAKKPGSIKQIGR